MTVLHERFHEVVEKVSDILASPRLLVFGRVDAWLKAGADPELDIYPTLKRLASSGRWSGSSLSYFDHAVAQSLADRTKPLPVVEPRSQKREHRYEAAAPIDDISRDAIDKMRAESLNKGLTVMSVTDQDARRMHAKGWLTPQAAERLGVE